MTFTSQDANLKSAKVVASIPDHICLTQVDCNNVLLDFIHALQGLPASRHLPSGRGGKNLLDDLSKLMTAVNADNFDPNDYSAYSKRFFTESPTMSS